MDWGKRKDQAEFYSDLRKRIFVFWNVTVYAFSWSLSAQEPINPLVHSHNDYRQSEPFWEAYRAGAGSIEVDIFLRSDTLYVTHEEDEIEPGMTLSKLYLEPLKNIVEKGDGPERVLQLLIDIKSEPYSSLEAIIGQLTQFLEIVNHPNVQMVISGSRPRTCEYSNYPEYLFFDYQEEDLNDECDIHSKIGLISLPFREYSRWDGRQPIVESDEEVITRLVNSAHKAGKKFRFWGSPDTPLAWRVLSELGVDFINTDNPKSCVEFFNKKE